MAGYNFARMPQKTSAVKTKYRLIGTDIPAPGTAEILDKLDRVESRSMHGQLPLIWDKAEDFSVYDIAGNCWIDFTSTIFVANVGHSNPRVTEAIRQQLDQSLYSTYSYPSIIRAEYIERLISFAGANFDKAFLLSAGTEATEAVMKLMRMHGQKKNKRCKHIVCFDGNWHGRTLGAQMMSGNKTQREWVGYQDEFIQHIPFPYEWSVGDKNGTDLFSEALKDLENKNVNVRSDISGFMLETFQGWGAIFYPKDFVQAIEKFCKENNILLAFDEMQSGFGRTGKSFGFKHYDVTPDLIACGKGMGGGVPLSGIIGRSEVMDLPETGNMSSTHSANPLVCAAGLAVIEELESRGFLDEAERKGKVFKKALNVLAANHSKSISWVSGQGMIQAICLKSPNKNFSDGVFASMVAERCMQKGLLVVHTGRETIKLGPPLTIVDDALLEGISVIGESIEEIILS